jgi:hypothetical protein
MEESEKNGQLQLELNDQVAQGTYANLVVITHSSSEFIVDFAQVLPGVPKAPVKSRVIMAPEHAKRLLYALEDNINKYEQMFGKIKMMEEQSLPPVTSIRGEA